MTREDEVDLLARRAFGAASHIINDAPDMGVALAAVAKLSRWMQAELDSALLASNKTLANIVIGDDER